MQKPDTITKCGPYLHWVFEDPTTTKSQKQQQVTQTLKDIREIHWPTNSIDTRDPIGHTLLNWLVICNNWSPLLEQTIVTVVTEFGASLVLQDSRGYTPLHWAVLFNRLEVTRCLMSLGADPRIKDAQGKDCYYYAHENEYLAVLEELGP